MFLKGVLKPRSLMPLRLRLPLLLFSLESLFVSFERVAFGMYVTSFVAPAPFTNMVVASLIIWLSASLCANRSWRGMFRSALRFATLDSASLFPMPMSSAMFCFAAMSSTSYMTRFLRFLLELFFAFPSFFLPSVFICSYISPRIYFGQVTLDRDQHAHTERPIPHVPYLSPAKTVITVAVITHVTCIFFARFINTIEANRLRLRVSFG